MPSNFGLLCFRSRLRLPGAVAVIPAHPVTAVVIDTRVGRFYHRVSVKCASRLFDTGHPAHGSVDLQQKRRPSAHFSHCFVCYVRPARAARRHSRLRIPIS